jgi:hypothetical protein
MVYRDSNGRTFKKRATRGIILGVPEETKGYAVYLKDDNPRSTSSLLRARNASLLATPPIEDDTSNARNGKDHPGNHATINCISTRTSKQRKPSERLKDALASSISVPNDESLVCNISLGDPLTYKAAMTTKHAKDW